MGVWLVGAAAATGPGVGAAEKSREQLIADLWEALRSPETDGMVAASLTVVLLGEEAYPPLVAALQDRDPVVRANAALVLGEVPEPGREAPPEVLQALRGALDDSDPTVREAAAEALASFQPEDQR